MSPRQRYVAVSTATPRAAVTPAKAPARARVESQPFDRQRAGKTDRENAAPRENRELSVATKVCRVSSPSFPDWELEEEEEAETLTFLSTNKFVELIQFSELQ
ncbi:hypothetical protein Q8A73_007767 [Channa argus]|nr:hypothetical protein Q8A73_007767 [Channa argus]